MRLRFEVLPLIEGASLRARNHNDASALHLAAVQGDLAARVNSRAAGCPEGCRKDAQCLYGGRSDSCFVLMVCETVLNSSLFHFHAYAQLPFSGLLFDTTYLLQRAFAQDAVFVCQLCTCVALAKHTKGQYGANKPRPRG